MGNQRRVENREEKGRRKEARLIKDKVFFLLIFYFRGKGKEKIGCRRDEENKGRS